MRNSQEVIGLSVIHLKSGKKMGTVTDLLFNEQQKFQGILLETDGFFHKRKFAPADHIQIGQDAVMIQHGDAIQPLRSEIESYTGILSGKKKLRGQAFMLSDGREIGLIENVYFMEELGTLIGYEVSEGLIHDFRYGRKLVQATEPLLWGDDVCIASADHVRIKDK
ncbi:PRC-barrel domain-containing protein [Hazenella sp. IB182357]|uniref:PRC-barrel domain-containing protein n=1 Tax=Polycladospora coralii TaxID=2771432 RepID=A0A926RTE6_9BACL|nr:PRC-barrel domain-containing protein [Polycladospora coralii]MBD1371069.1 PRC-barrel domain-containing protein [Polycladospora coralii]MBS7530008.1 PRC-barrel domain-containing protein [Polycladospora coralii]